MNEQADFTLRVETSLADVSAADWDRLANPGYRLSPDGRHEALVEAPDSRDERPESSHELAESTPEEAESPLQGTPFNPFISHAFLLALEEAGCAVAETGWLGQHLILQDPLGRMVGAAPCYLKNHSQGEYVFDHGWADAFERAGGNYYPKLQVSVPFTPASGRRLFTAPSLGRDAGRQALAAGLTQLCAKRGASSAHLTFLPEEDARALADLDYLLRMDQQFHWHNDGYASYDDFLGALASRKRKALRKERREALSSGLTIEWLSGKDITEAHWDAFYAFYMDTGARKWGRPYLNRTFFSLLGERLGGSTLLMLACRDGKPVAGALNMIGSDTLYGRYWGCSEDHPYLHFELCYHQAIDYAIAHDLAHVEAGAQGEHKLARGYVPTTTYSAHWIAHPGLRDAIEDYLVRERQAVDFEQKILSSHAPYKRGERTDSSI
jgi:uncharacterized protein